MYALGVILDSVELYFQTSKENVNLVAGLNTGFIFLCGPAVAGFANQFSIRAVIMFGATCASMTMVLSTFSHDIYLMMVSLGLFVGRIIEKLTVLLICRYDSYKYFVAGIFMGANYLPSVWQVSLYFSKKRGIANGITMAGSGNVLL
jgi:hypothetical protein